MLLSLCINYRNFYSLALGRNSFSITVGTKNHTNKLLSSITAYFKHNWRWLHTLLFFIYIYVWFACWLKLDSSIAPYNKEQFYNPMYFAFIKILVLSGTFIKIIQLAFGFSSCTQCLLIWKWCNSPIYKIHNGRAYALASVGLGLL